MSSRVVYICGTHSSVTEVPIPEDVEVWRLNNGWEQGRYDRLYELHKLSDRPWRTPEHLDHLKRAGRKVWMFFPGPYKRASRYPVLEVLEWAPVPYFTTSFAWMFAHALYEGVKEIHILGAMFQNAQERAYERACVEFWLGYAKGSGVKVIVPPVSALLKGPGLYGLEDSIHTAINAFLPPGRFPDWYEYAFSGVYEPQES